MPLVAAVVLLFLFAAFANVARARRRMELRADLLDLLAAAARRAAPFPPLLRAAATGRRRRVRRAILGVVGRLEDGASLTDAFETLGRTAAPPHLVAALRAAEGTSRLPAVLEAQAADTAAALEVRHRVLLASLYPFFLAASVLALHAFCIGLLHRGSGQDDVTPIAGAEGAVILVGLVLAAAVGFVGAPLLARWIRGPGLCRLAQGRLLLTGARLVEAGLPADEAFTRAAAAGGHRGLERRLGRAARRVAEGAPMDVLWDAMGLPASDRVRLAAAGPRLPDVLDAAGARALARWQRAADAWIRWLRPIGVAAVGLLVLVDFRLVMAWLEHARAEAMPW